MELIFVLDSVSGDCAGSGFKMDGNRANVERAERLKRRRTGRLGDDSAPVRHHCLYMPFSVKMVLTEQVLRRLSTCTWQSTLESEYYREQEKSETTFETRHDTACSKDGASLEEEERGKSSRGGKLRGCRKRREELSSVYLLPFFLERFDEREVGPGGRQHPSAVCGHVDSHDGSPSAGCASLR